MLKVSIINSVVEDGAEGFLGAVLAHHRIERIADTFLSEMLRHDGVRICASNRVISICKRHAEHFSTLKWLVC